MDQILSEYTETDYRTFLVSKTEESRISSSIPSRYLSKKKAGCVLSWLSRGLIVTWRTHNDQVVGVDDPEFAGCPPRVKHKKQGFYSFGHSAVGD